MIVHSRSGETCQTFCVKNRVKVGGRTIFRTHLKLRLDAELHQPTQTSMRRLGRSGTRRVLFGDVTAHDKPQTERKEINGEPFLYLLPGG